jgi:sugar-specific transcriptional regulator TrmB
MNLDNEKLAELKHVFNLNLYEVKLWTALLAKGTASAGELSESSNVPRSRAYDVLESLEKRGFITVKLGKPINYVAVDPEEVLERVKKEIESKRDARIRATDTIKKSSVFSNIKKTYETRGTPSVKSTAPTAIRGRNNIYSKLSGLISKANSNVIVVSDENGILRKSYELGEALKQAKQNGASVKLISKFSRGDDRIKKLKSLFDLKDSKTVNMRFVVVDNHLALFTSHSEEMHPSNETCVLINSSFVSNTFKNIFF